MGPPEAVQPFCAMTSEFFDQDETSLDRSAAQAEQVEGAEGAMEGAAEASPEVAEAEEETPPEVKELEELRDRYLRLAAEFDNYRKRTDRERLEVGDRAQAQLLEKLLDPLDDLRRVSELSVAGSTVESVLEGIKLVEQKFYRVLEAAGLEAVHPTGQPFDPEQHEALMTTSAATPEEDGTVGEVFQTGYRFRGSLLRPARVQVRQHGG